MNSQFYNEFYSKLCYESDPDEEYIWVYCSIGFTVMIFSLVALKIISVLIEKGIIQWSKSSSSDDDPGSNGITVHFNSSTTGILTEGTSNSNKSEFSK
jgi:hypothetical protein